MKIEVKRIILYKIYSYLLHINDIKLKAKGIIKFWIHAINFCLTDYKFKDEKSILDPFWILPVNLLNLFKII